MKRILELEPLNDQAKRTVHRLEPLAEQKREKMKEEMIGMTIDSSCSALSSASLLLSPHGVTDAHLTGRITPKSGADLAVMGELFTNFLQSKNQTISIRGNSVQPTGSATSVAWLSSAFRSLTLDVTLPGQSLQVHFLNHAAS